MPPTQCAHSIPAIAKLIEMLHLAFNSSDNSRHSWNMYTFSPALDTPLRKTPHMVIFNSMWFNWAV